MMTMEGRSSETSKWCNSLWAFKAVSQNFFCFLCLKDSITYNENMMGTTFGGFFEKAICSILANLENIIISEPLSVIIDCHCLFTMQVLVFNIKISLFCHNKYEIFLYCGHRIKVCAECS